MRLLKNLIEFSFQYKWRKDESEFGKYHCSDHPDFTSKDHSVATTFRLYGFFFETLYKANGHWILDCRFRMMDRKMEKIMLPVKL